jgi:DNA-binding transcriptional MerR regulator
MLSCLDSVIAPLYPKNSPLCYNEAMGKIKESFSTGEATRITGVSFRNMDYWAKTKFIVPSVAEARGIGTERRYSFSDLVALRTAREFREAGVTTRSLRRAVEFLQAKDGPLLADFASWKAADCWLIVTRANVQIATNSAQLAGVLQTRGATSVVFVLDLGRIATEALRLQQRAVRRLGAS